jgi:hypothetical protein
MEMEEDELARVVASIRVAEADLSRAKDLGREDLEVAINNRLTELLRKEHRLSAGMANLISLTVFYFYIAKFPHLSLSAFFLVTNTTQ